MSTIITGTSITTDNVVASTDVTAQGESVVSKGFKNYIINGCARVWQRGTYFSGANVYTADRWIISGIGSSSQAVISQISTSQTIQSRIKINFASNLTVQHNFTQKIEDLKQFSNKTLTLSFWYYIQSDGSTFGINKIRPVMGQTFGSDATTYKTLSALDTSTNSVWQKYESTFTCDDFAANTFGSNHNLSLNIVFDATTLSGALQIAEIQLEDGSVATPFERRSYGLELSLCQRYYYKATSANYGSPYARSTTADGQLVGNLIFPVTMRTQPTISGATVFNGTLTAVVLTGNESARYYGTATTTSAAGISAGWEADAEL